MCTRDEGWGQPLGVAGCVGMLRDAHDRLAAPPAHDRLLASPRAVHGRLKRSYQVYSRTAGWGHRNAHDRLGAPPCARPAGGPLTTGWEHFHLLLRHGTHRQ